MPLTFDVIGLAVADMAASLSFYRGLGLDIPAEADTEPHVEVNVPSGIKLTFDTEEVITSFDPSFAPPPGRGRAALAFRAGSPQEVDDTYAAMVAAGFSGHLPPWDAFWGQRYAVLHDPDGNATDLYAALPA